MKKAKKPAPIVEPEVAQAEPALVVGPKAAEAQPVMPPGYIWDNSSACFKKNGP